MGRSARARRVAAVGAVLGLLAGAGLLLAPAASAGVAPAASPPPPGLKLAPGLAAATFASGFRAGAPGPADITFGPNGEVFVSDVATGSVFRFGRDGGVADASHELAAR